MKGLRSDMESGGHHDGGCSFEESRVVDNFKLQLNKMVAKVDELEQRVSEVAQFYSSLSKKQPSNSKGGLIVKDRDEEKQVANKKPLDPARKEPPSSKRKLELMRQISTVLRQEARGKREEAEALADMQLAQEAANAKIARDISNELYELDSYLDELREMVVQKCRKMTTEEKRKLGIGLSRLSPEDLNSALEIIAQKNPSFQPTAEEVDLDMDAQSESTLWRLKFFVKNALEVQAKSATARGHDNSKRKREICDALAKTAKKRGKKLSA